MTKKLIWRLKEQPSTESLQELVKNGILTKDEAREILFSSEEVEERDKKSLESEIKFLRELVEKLSHGSYTKTIEIIREIDKPWRQYPWYNPYIVWCSSGVSTYNGSGGSGILSYNTSNGMASIGSLNTNVVGSNFTSIKTF